jgi:ABC-2 type transport system permease protein
MTTRTSPPSAVEAPPAVVAGEPRPLPRVWWRTYLHHLRLLRNPSIAWISGLAGISMGVAATVDHRIGTEAERQALAAMEDVPAFMALQGRMVDVATVEGFTLARWGMFGILVAVWAMLAAVRLLRGAEESGHVELLRCGAITPRGLLGAVLASLFTVHAAFGTAIGVSHTAVGMDAATSWTLGGAAALLAATFAAAGALSSQLVATRRRAASLVGAFLGVTLGIRVFAAATATPDWVWWTTPFGWMGFLHEVDASRGAVFTGFLALVTVLAAAAFVFVRRDLHAGPLGHTDGVVRRSRPVGGQTSLAVRATVGATTTWAIVVATLSLAFGLLTRDFVDAVAELGTMVEVGRELFGMVLDTPEGMVGATFFFVAVLLAVCAAGLGAAIREEEATWRLEHLLVRPLGRVRWLVTRVLVAAGGLLVIAIGGGVVAWAGTVASGASVGLGDAILAGVNVVPVAWLFLGVGVAILGIAPRLTAPLTYGLVVVAFLLDFVGPFLDPPAWVLDLTPFRHVASVPAVEMDVAASVVMLAIGLVGAGVGLLAFQRRDLKEA